MMLSVKRLTLEQWMDCLRNGTTLGDSSTNPTAAMLAAGGAVEAKPAYHQQHSERSDARNNQMKHNGTARCDMQSDVIELWRQAVLGDSVARDALLQRIMPASAMNTHAVMLTLDLPLSRRPTATVLA